jgi:hypothetical protein
VCSSGREDGERERRREGEKERRREGDVRDRDDREDEETRIALLSTR